MVTSQLGSLMRSDSRLCRLSNLKLNSGYKLRCNHVPSESVWLPVSDRFAVSFRIVLLQPVRINIYGVASCFISFRRFISFLGLLQPIQ